MDTGNSLPNAFWAKGELYWFLMSGYRYWQVSDVWNGLHGDGGFAACMTAVDGADHGTPNLKSSCAVSVESVVLRGTNGTLAFGSGSPPECSIFTL